MSRICRQRLCVFVRFLTQSICLSVALRFLSSLPDNVLVFRPLKVLSTYISSFSGETRLSLPIRALNSIHTVATGTTWGSTWTGDMDT